MNQRLSRLTAVFTLFLVAVFSPLAVIFTKEFAVYITDFSKNSGIDFLQKEHIYIAGLILALPCVLVLFLALKLSSAIKNDEIFTVDSACGLALISKILFFDSLLLLLCVIALFYIGERTVSPLLGIVDLIGIALSVLLNVISGYLRNAAVLKEESDATL